MQAINSSHLNPINLTDDLAKRLGGFDNVPHLSAKAGATNNLEYIVDNNDFIALALTMNRLPDFLALPQQLLKKKEGAVCIISPLKRLIADEKWETCSPIQCLSIENLLP